MKKYIITFFAFLLSTQYTYAIWGACTILRWPESVASYQVETQDFINALSQVLSDSSCPVVSAQSCLEADSITQCLKNKTTDKLKNQKRILGNKMQSITNTFRGLTSIFSEFQFYFMGITKNWTNKTVPEVLYDQNDILERQYKVFELYLAQIPERCWEEKPILVDDVEYTVEEAIIKALAENLFIRDYYQELVVEGEVKDVDFSSSDTPIFLMKEAWFTRLQEVYTSENIKACAAEEEEEEKILWELIKAIVSGKNIKEGIQNALDESANRASKRVENSQNTLSQVWNIGQKISNIDIRTHYNKNTQSARSVSELQNNFLGIQKELSNNEEEVLENIDIDPANTENDLYSVKTTDDVSDILSAVSKADNVFQKIVAQYQEAETIFVEVDIEINHVTDVLVETHAYLDSSYATIIEHIPAAQKICQRQARDIGNCSP